MSALTTPFAPDDLFRLSVDQYHGLIERGILGSEDRVELLEGVLVRKMKKIDPHILATRRCRRILVPLLPAGSFYEADQPVSLLDSEPEPDGVIIIGSVDDAQLTRPSAAHLALVIEIADTSLSRDRKLKLPSYARAGVVCYWIINLIDRQIEVYTKPDPTADLPTYLDRKIFTPGQRLPLVIEQKTLAEIAVDDLLPPA